MSRATGGMAALQRHFGSGLVRATFTVKSAEYTASIADGVVLVDASGRPRDRDTPSRRAERWLPPDRQENRLERERRHTLDGNGAETIDGAATVSMAVQNMSYVKIRQKKRDYRRRVRRRLVHPVRSGR